MDEFWNFSFATTQPSSGMGTAATAIQINNLPTEILEAIFDRLPFRPRLTAKLVCRHWCTILLAEKYRSQEKIVCRGFYGGGDKIIGVLSRYTYELQHLEFDRVQLSIREFDSSFWKAHGARINELHFRNCIINLIDVTLVFVCVATHCVNLKSLYWDHDGGPICSSDALDGLIGNNFSRENLLVFETSAVSLQWLLKFRKVFPNAERLSYWLDPWKEPSVVYDEELNLPAVSEKKLSLKFRNLPTHFLWNALTSAFSLQTLQEIEVDADMGALPQAEFLRVVSEQRLLEKVKFLDKMGGIQAGFGERLLKTLFEKCLKLQWLHLELENHDLMIDAQLFSKIKSSQLSYLWLECAHVRFDEVLYSNLPTKATEKNYTLRHLATYSRLESAGFHLLLQSFTCLQHLEINWFKSNEVLKSIATNQSQLRSLRFISGKLERDIKKKEDVGENEDEDYYQFLHLAKLQNLKYSSIWFSGTLQKDKLAEFHLPNLEYLYIKVVQFALLYITG